MQAESASDAKVVGIDKPPVDLHLLAVNADVCDPVLAAAVRASSDVQFQMLIETGQSLFQLFHQPAGEALRFGDCKLAELRTAASDSSAKESRAADLQSNRVQFLGQGSGVSLRNIYDDQVLHVGGAQFPRCKALCQVGSGLHLLGGNSSAKHRRSHITQARLLLRMNSDVVAIHIRGRMLFDGGIESESDALLQFVEKTLCRPAMAQEKKFQPRPLAMLAQHFRIAKEFGDSLNGRQHLVPADKGVKSCAEVRFGGQPSGNSQ